jgi:hypothetical protein
MNSVSQMLLSVAVTVSVSGVVSFLQPLKAMTAESKIMEEVKILFMYDGFGFDVCMMMPFVQGLTAKLDLLRQRSNKGYLIEIGKSAVMIGIWEGHF